MPPHHTQVIDLDSPSLAQNMLLKEQEEQENDKVARARYIINYQEQENKQLEDKQTQMELEMLKIQWQSNKEHQVPLTPIEQEVEHEREIRLERVNIHLEGLLKKANRDNKMLRHMAHHYLTQNRICNKRIKHLKERLRRALKGKKKDEKLNILADVTLAQKKTHDATLSQNWENFETILSFSNF